MKLITHKDILDLNISLGECFNWTTDMIKNKNKAILPAKISMKPYEGVFCNVMPTFIPSFDGDYEGIKVVTRYPGRVPELDSKLLLLNANNGEFLALMDADWITTVRTGATAAHSIMLLAKENYKTIGIIGLGNVSRATILFLLTMNPNKQFTFKLYKHHDQEISFKERFKNFNNIKFEEYDSYHDVVKGSDVVISGVTYAPQDFCNNDSFDEGVLVVPIHTLGFTNCDLFFDKVFADDTNHVKHFKYFDKFNKFGEVSDVVNGKIKGRENNKERILVYNIGTAIHDINYATHIYNLLKNKKLDEIEFKSPTEKFWI